jgi:hypothetical protein
MLIQTLVMGRGCDVTSYYGYSGLDILIRYDSYTELY